MDFRGKRKVIINGKEKSMLFYEDKLIWSKLYGEFAKDFKNLMEDEAFEGKYNPQKGALMISSEYLRLPPIIEIEGDKSIKIEYGGTFNLPRVKAYTVSGETLTPRLEIYRDGAKVEKVDTKTSGKYELRYTAEIEGKRSQVSYFVEVDKAKYRFVRDSIMRDISGQSPHFRQVKVFDMQGKNIALNKPVTSVGPIWSGDVKTLVDGNPFDNFLDIDGRYLTEPASVTVDLQGQFEIKSIQIWHREGRKYPDAKVEVSVDGKEWRTIFDAKVNGAYDETTEGKTHILG